MSGPRAGASAVFTDGDAPLRLLVATWDSVDRYDERRLVSADEAVGTLLASRDKRGPRASLVEVVSATLGYWAGEYAGGADVLEPSWFVELAHAGDPEVRPRSPAAGAAPGRRLAIGRPVPLRAQAEAVADTGGASDNPVMRGDTVPTFCPLCVSRCGARATVADGTFVALQPTRPTRPARQSA